MTCSDCTRSGKCAARQQHPHDCGPDKEHCDGFDPLPWFALPRKRRDDPRTGKNTFRKARTCEACGSEEAVWNPPLVCNKCREVLHEAWVQQRARNREAKKYCIHFGTSTPNSNGPGQEAVTVIGEGLRALFPQTGAYTDDGLESGEAINTERRTWSDGHYYIMTPGQAEQVKNILTALRTVADAVYREGFEKGRQLLQGIADGSLSTNDVGEWCQRYGRTEEEQ